MGFEKTQPDLNVYFINTINTTAPNYGATLSNEYLSLIDNSNISAFGTVGGGSLYIKQLQPVKGIGNYWTPSSAGVAGVITVAEGSLAANTTYTFILNQYIPSGAPGNPAILSPAPPIQAQNIVTSGGSLSYQTGTVTPSVGTVVTALAAIINANAGFHVTTSITGGTLTITANTGYFKIWTNVQAATGVPTLSGNLTITQVTQGVLSQGYTYDMYDDNSFGTDWASFPGYVPTNIYSQFAATYTDLIYGNTVNLFVFVNSGDPNYGSTSSGFVYSFVNNALAMGGVLTSANSFSVLSLLQQANALEYTSL